MFRTLYSKLALTLLVLFVLVGAMFFLLMRSMFELQEEAVNQQLNRDLAVRLVAEFLDGRDDLDRPQRLKGLFTQVMHLNPSIEAYQVDAEGQVTAHEAPPERMVRRRIDLAPVRAFLAPDVRFPLRGDDPRDPSRRKVFSAAPLDAGPNPSGYLYLILAGEERTMLASSARGGSAWISTIGVMAGGLAFALLAGVVTFKLLTERLQHLARAMDAFRRGGFEHEARYVTPHRPTRDDEIDRLGTTYNEMAERIMAQLRDLRDADAMRRDLVANVSHDLRTPIASIRGYLETLLLKREALPDAERHHYLETAQRQSVRLAKLVDDLFDLAKLDAREIAPSFEPFPIAELAHDVVQGSGLAAQEKGIRLDVSMKPGLPFVKGDIGLLERVLQNLIDNAIRHTPAGGLVRVELTPDDTFVRVAVVDTGSGIPPESLERIFDRFFTLDRSRSGRTGGTGLGLAIAARVVELHGGRLEVESLVGEGTRFTFRLPVAVAAVI